MGQARFGSYVFSLDAQYRLESLATKTKYRDYFTVHYYIRLDSNETRLSFAMKVL